MRRPTRRWPRHSARAARSPRGEILHAVEHEAAITLADAVIRRTEAGSAGHPGDDALAAAAAVWLPHWAGTRRASPGDRGDVGLLRHPRTSRRTSVPAAATDRCALGTAGTLLAAARWSWSCRAASCPLTGYAGRVGCAGGFFFSSSRATAIARSSCGSRPAITSFGVCSTSMSGGTPSFSTTQPSSGVQIAMFGAVIVPPSISVGKPSMPTRPPHVR